MTAFTEAYAQLNAAQKQAVDMIDGPLLVIAGPGTGKTQLLSVRVANILQRTDTPAQNILCLTFTVSGALNMRERLTNFIGQEAYNVNIGTYHSFGSDLIGRYPEYFSATRLQTAVDDLGKRQIVQEIVEALSYTNPLKQTRHHLGDLMSTISELKRALLSSSDLRALSDENASFITDGSRKLQPIFQDFTRMPSSYVKAAPYFQQVLLTLSTLVTAEPVSVHFKPLATLCISQLQAALEKAAATNKTTELTRWKNNWLAKDADNHFIIAGELENRRIHALADVLDSYLAALTEQGLYDFDDMILRSIEVLEHNADLRYTLQERYLYILLDEFQDTNAAQLRLIQLLTDNPVNEGRPNILAVGDDDQAIYAFQGAQYSNMLTYYRMFHDTAIINLTENYRSQAAILTSADAVAEQIESRLHQQFDDLPGSKGKTLRAANDTLPLPIIRRREFQSMIAERAWIAGRIKALIESGTAPSQIAILAPKHKQLEPLVPYLNAQAVPVRYEKRENILNASVVRQLITMSQLLLALSAGNVSLASALWPEILSYDFWQIPTDVIWRMSWQVSDSQTSHDEDNQRLSWNQAVLDNDNAKVRQAACVLLATAGHVGVDSCETILDYLIGSAALETHQPADKARITDQREPNQFTTVASPLKDYYTSATVQSKNPELFYETLSHLTVLRAKLRDFQDRADGALTLNDFIRFIALYEAAEQPMIDTSPYSQQADAVQLLTVFKAKGLEYEHVFLPQCLDDVWGSSSRGSSNKLTLPANLQPIRHAGATDDERLRILFVAMTRAKWGLYLTSSSQTFSGTLTKRLKYFDEQEQPDGSFHAMVLPLPFRTIESDDSEALSAELFELDWRSRHLNGLHEVSLASLLSGRTDNYQLSPTHLTSFIDLEYAGPQRFFFDTILKFPSAPSPDSQFGTAIHETLEWYQHQTSEHGFAPTTIAAIEHFSIRLAAKKLTTLRQALEIERGTHALTTYLKQRGHIFTSGESGIRGVAEKNFRSEGVFYGEVHMAGRIDRLEINPVTKTIIVVDYKTGKSYSSWQNEVRLHKYQLQLYAYKLLVEGSRRYAGYKVMAGRLEFIESDSEGRVRYLELPFQVEETERVKYLIAAVWRHVRSLSFPSPAASNYPATVNGIKHFEQDLIDDRI